MGSALEGTAFQDQFATKSVTYAAGSTGLQGTATVLFTVTGEILIVSLVPFCEADLTQVAPTPTLELGVVGNTAILLGSTTATTIDTGKFWLDTTPAEVGAVPIPAALIDIAVTADVQCLVGGSSNIDAGVIRYDLFWRALSSDGLVVAA